jgi:hypothetical protein
MILLVQKFTKKTLTLITAEKQILNHKEENPKLLNIPAMLITDMVKKVFIITINDHIMELKVNLK